MPTETKVSRRYCRHCRQRTVHQATIQQADLSFSTLLGHGVLSVITLGLWLPFAMLLIFVQAFRNSLRRSWPSYYCQRCHR